MAKREKEQKGIADEEKKKIGKLGGKSINREKK